MRGLLYKDFRILRSTLLIYIPLIIIMSVFTPDSTFVTSFTTVMLVIIPASCFAVDENCGWDKYTGTLPVGRNTVVGARYLMVLVLLAGVAVLFLLTNLLPHASHTMNERFASLIGTLAFVMVELPLLYKFGRKMWIYLVAALIGGPLSVLFILLQGPMAGLTLFLLAVCFWISYKISCSIAANSEY